MSGEEGKERRKREAGEDGKKQVKRPKIGVNEVTVKTVKPRTEKDYEPPRIGRSSVNVEEWKQDIGEEPVKKNEGKEEDYENKVDENLNLYPDKSGNMWLVSDVKVEEDVEKEEPTKKKEEDNNKKQKKEKCRAPKIIDIPTDSEEGEKTEVKVEEVENSVVEFKRPLDVTDTVDIADQAEVVDLVDVLRPGSLLDSHCHLDFILRRRVKPLHLHSWPQLLQRYPALHNRALGGFVTNYCEPCLWPPAGTAPPLTLVSAWLEPGLRARYTVGCHPHFAPRLLEEGVMEELEQLLEEGRGRGCMAVGECGMDASRGNRVPMEVQAEAFLRQLELAMRLELPLVLHIREAEAAGLEVLRAAGLPGTWPVHRHCWNDTWEAAAAWLEEFPGSVIGLTDLVSHRGAMGDRAREVARQVPLDRLVLETDAPYFKPRQLEGLMGLWGQPQFCHPLQVVSVARAVAQVRNCLLQVSRLFLVSLWLAWFYWF